MGQLTNNGKTVIEEDSDGDTNIRPDSLNGAVIPVGPSGKYADLNSAYSDLSPTASDRYVLSLTDNISESSRVEPKSHVDLRGNGYHIESNEGSQAAVHFRGVRDCTWRGVTIDHRPGSVTGAFSPLRFTNDDPPNEQTLRFKNITTIGSEGGGKAPGVRVRHSSRPVFSDCLFISGKEDGSFGGHIIHGAAPTFYGCAFYNVADKSSSGGDSGVSVEDASTAKFHACAAYGATGNGCNAWELQDNCAPTLEGCYGGGAQYSGFISGPGDESFNPTKENGIDTMASPLAAEDFNARLESITINIYNAVSSGTIDVGTSDNGTEIIDGADASSVQRINPSYSQVNFSPGDTVYITTSDSAIDYGVRWTVRRTRFEASGISISTTGQATVNGGTFHGGPKASAGVINTTTRRYQVNGTTFINSDSSSAALSSPNSGTENVANYVARNTNSSGSDTNNIS